MELKAVVKSGVSKKGNDYVIIEITYPNGYKMAVFPNDAEKALLKLLNDIN